MEIFTNQAGCDSTVTMTFGHVPFPEAEIAVNGVILFAKEIAGASYQWYNCDTNEPISGEDKRQLTPPRTGEYYVEVTTAGCSSVSDCLFFDWVLAVEDKVETQLYPTVSNGTFTIETSEIIADAVLQVFTISGKPVLQKHYKTFKNEKLNMETKQGIYMIRLLSDNQALLTRQIIIKD